MSDAGANRRKQPVCFGKPEGAPRGEVILEDTLIRSKVIRVQLLFTAAYSLQERAIALRW